MFQQGEAFVPESTVRFGKRTGGRDVVLTIMADDERIKYVLPPNVKFCSLYT
jgi:hypothetical protein